MDASLDKLDAALAAAEQAVWDASGVFVDATRAHLDPWGPDADPSGDIHAHLSAAALALRAASAVHHAARCKSEGPAQKETS